MKTLKEVHVLLLCKLACILHSDHPFYKPSHFRCDLVILVLELRFFFHADLSTHLDVWINPILPKEKVSSTGISCG